MAIRYGGHWCAGRARPPGPDGAARLTAITYAVSHGLAALAAEDLATAAGCSRYAIYRSFRATYGLAPSEYQRQLRLRLRAARRLLARGGHLAQVAADVGFADQAHLTRWFVRTFGLTPGSYGRAVRG